MGGQDLAGGHRPGRSAESRRAPAPSSECWRERRSLRRRRPDELEHAVGQLIGRGRGTRPTGPCRPRSRRSASRFGPSGPPVVAGAVGIVTERAIGRPRRARTSSTRCPPHSSRRRCPGWRRRTTASCSHQTLRGVRAHPDTCWSGAVRRQPERADAKIREVVVVDQHADALAHVARIAEIKGRADRRVVREGRPRPLEAPPPGSARSPATAAARDRTRARRRSPAVRRDPDPGWRTIASRTCPREVAVGDQVHTRRRVYRTRYTRPGGMETMQLS